MSRKTERLAQLAQDATRYGIGADDLIVLLRCERTLHCWYEKECGDSNDYAGFSIERDEDTGVPYWCVYPHTAITPTRTKIADREAGAKRRVLKILARYPHLHPLFKTDPRGCALHVVRTADLTTDPQTNGLAICAE